MTLFDLSKNTLAPFSLTERLYTATHMISFFHAPNNERNRSIIGKQPNTAGTIEALTLMDFYQYSKVDLGADGDPNRFLFKFREIARELELHGFLDSSPGSGAFQRTYWTIYGGATQAQFGGHLYLAPLMGSEFLVRSFAAATVSIHGQDLQSGSPVTGTGLLLNSTHVLTNKHVVEGMTIQEVRTSVVAPPLSLSESVEQRILSATSSKAHESIDVAVVEVAPTDGGDEVAFTEGLAFRNPEWADRAMTFGYPRVPLAIDPIPVVVHDGCGVSPVNGATSF